MKTFFIIFVLLMLALGILGGGAGLPFLIGFIVVFAPGIFGGKH